MKDPRRQTHHVRRYSAAILGLTLLSGCAPFFGQEDPEAVGGGPSVEDVTITMVDVDFNPNKEIIPAGTEVMVHLPNEGSLGHNFSIDELDIDVDVAAGETKTITLEAPAGTYTYYCAKPGHRALGMEGTLRVVQP
ncbi:cupredoxin domain-containing protein [Proteobacteria bacterium 005FR1]|nr:cupredoxin domain-containing protein [Proteobacteria bacterium 005FR1]